MMSETSTPSMNLHAISPSSSFSSADSAPHSDPTSDEQPDLGAFTTVLREWTHLQPGPRIPVQRRTATSSTTPTFQPTEPSVAGSVQSSSYRPTSSYRRRRVPSSQSTFTRPPSSSAAPDEGSTVWDHGLIANYLLSATPSNDYDLDDYYELDAVDEEGESQYNPSPPNSVNSTSLTVEINSESDVPTTDNESIRISPYPYSERGLLVPVQGPDKRLNSRESNYPLDEGTTDDASTYRNQRTSQNSRTSPGSFTSSLQLQSQAPVSSSSSSGTDVILSVVSTASAVQEHQSNAANSQSTTMSNFVSTLMNRSQNPIPPQTVYPSPNVEPVGYASTSTSTSSLVSQVSLSTQRPTQQVLQRLRDNSTSPPLLNPHSPQPPHRQNNHVWSLPSGSYQGVVNDWGTPDQAPSETLLFEPPARVSRFRPVFDDDNEEEVVAARQPSSSLAAAPQVPRRDNTSNHIYSNHPISNLSGTSTMSHSQGPPTRTESTIEPYNEDEETDEDLYNHRYPYSHGFTPRYYGSALTPRGLPPRQDPRTSSQVPPSSLQLSSHHATTSTTQEHDLTYLNAAYTNTVPGPTHPQSSQSHSYSQNHVQQNHRSQQSEMGEAPDPPSQRTDAQTFTHEIEQIKPIHPQPTTQLLPQSTQHHIAHPFHEPLSLQPRTQTHWDRPDASASAKHGYPHSLRGFHALPASLPPPTPDDRPLAFLVEETPDSSRVQSRLADSETQSNFDEHARSTVDDEIDNMPSLGALDEVLEFIAVERERARTNAAREAASLRMDPDPDSEEHEDSADEALGDVDWHNVVDNDQDQEQEQVPEINVELDEAKPELTKGKEKEQVPDKEAAAEPDQELEQHRRRRRRKRPVKPQSAAAAALSTDSVGTPSSSAVKDSPSGRKRRRVRSSSRSAASVLQTPGREKEFLVDPSALLRPAEQSKSQITILKRPTVGPSDDGHQDPGAKTPTNLASGGRDMDLRNRDAFQDRALQAGDLQFDLEYDPVSQTRAGGTEDDGEGGNDTSLSNMALLQPPRRKRDKSGRSSTKDAAYIHDILGGSYRSTPATPGHLQKPGKQLEEEVENAAQENPDVAVQDVVEESVPLPSEKKKRIRKHRKAIPHAKSVPDLKSEAEQQETSPATTIANPLPGLSRAKSLSKQSQSTTLRGRDPSDTQRDELERYLAASYNAMPGLFMMERPRDPVSQPDPNSKRGRLITLAHQLRQSFPEQNEELSKLITRFSQAQGPKVKGKRGKSAPDVFEVAEGNNDAAEEDDGLDTRGRSSKRSPILTHVFIDHSNILIGLLTHIRRLRSKRQKAATKNPASAFAAVKPSNTRPLPLPISSDGVGMTIQASQNYPIPLPSFATSRSLPTKSVLSTYMEAQEAQFSDEATGNDTISDDYEEVVEGSSKSEKKQLTHLWHAALVLILERGRDVNRRVVVTSSPLYQPMESIERLGYDLRVYIRVPDLGDGLDRERQKEKYGSKSSSSGKSVQSPARGIGHMRQPSGNISTDSGNDGVVNATPPRVKYREQGVDELLQLKLHQALIATDQPPEGSTIVLATGDGNTGQFNEDGFLGAVRAALRKGWKVELYSWEYGLSSSWRREFGEFSKRGMFRIIYMEQFTSSLLEANTLV